MLANALDTDAKHITISLSRIDDYYRLSFGDDGSKQFSDTNVKMLFDFGNNASSKRGVYRVQRGALGNALKCIFGYTFAIPESLGLPPQEIVIRSHGVEYTIKLQPDRVREVIESTVSKSSTDNVGYNTFIVSYPVESSTVNEGDLVGLITATSILNPRREISYDILGHTGQLGEAKKFEAVIGYTSVLWYREQEFTALFEDYVRANPRLTLVRFISMFRGFTGRDRQAEILQAINVPANHDPPASSMHFFADTPISTLRPSDVKSLYSSMYAGSSPLSPRSVPSSLGMVGKATLTDAFTRMGWRGLKYGHTVETYTSGEVKFPYIMELAVLDRPADDAGGLKVYHCVNFMASTEKILSAEYSVELHLGLVGIKRDTPVTLILHLVSPRVEWLNHAKSGIWVEAFNQALIKLLKKVLPIPKSPKNYVQKPPRPPRSWVPVGKIGDMRYEWRLSIFAGEILRLNEENKRNLKYSPRGWTYILEGLGKVHKGEFKKVGTALTDCRKIGLLPMDFFAEDQDETRRFSALHDALDPRSLMLGVRDQIRNAFEGLAPHTTDYWDSEKYFVMMCVEKGDIRNLYEPICSDYHVPIVSSKGWSPLTLLRDIVSLSVRAESRGLTPVLLLFYDHDPAGLKITKLFKGKLREIRRATGWDPKDLIIERIGLNKVEIDEYNLSWIENLKSAKGRESRDKDYISQFGKRKCESNALFKNEETLKAAECICRTAIERYYGVNALSRFKAKEHAQREKLSNIYDDPVWENIDSKLCEIAKTFPDDIKKNHKPTIITPQEDEIAVYLDERYYGSCPNCGTDFNYDPSMIGHLMRCRTCYKPMRLKSKSNSN